MSTTAASISFPELEASTREHLGRLAPRYRSGGLIELQLWDAALEATVTSYANGHHDESVMQMPDYAISMLEGRAAEAATLSGDAVDIVRLQHLDAQLPRLRRARYGYETRLQKAREIRATWEADANARAAIRILSAFDDPSDPRGRALHASRWEGYGMDPDDLRSAVRRTLLRVERSLDTTASSSVRFSTQGGTLPVFENAGSLQAYTQRQDWWKAQIRPVLIAVKATLSDPKLKSYNKLARALRARLSPLSAQLEGIEPAPLAVTDGSLIATERALQSYERETYRVAEHIEDFALVKRALGQRISELRGLQKSPAMADVSSLRTAKHPELVKGRTQTLRWIDVALRYRHVHHITSVEHTFGAPVSDIVGNDAARGQLARWVERSPEPAAPETRNAFEERCLTRALPGLHGAD